MTRRITDETHLDRVPEGGSREAFVPLLLLADEPQPLHEYLNEGDLYVLSGPADDTIGVTLVMPDQHEPGTVELRAVAISEKHHNRGYGRRMLSGVLADLRARGKRRVIVGTSNAGIGQIAFYQKAGFRLWRIERDYFTPEKGYDPEEKENGLSHRDMVWFDLDLD